MGAVPEYLRAAAAADEETGLVPISYDALKGEFCIGGRRVSLGDCDPFDDNLLSNLEVDEAGVKPLAVGEHPLYLTPLPGRLLATSRFHQWAKGHAAHVRCTPDVIGAAYRRIRGEEAGTGAQSRGLPVDCNTELFSDGCVFLRTVGNCACLGCTASPMLLRSQTEGGFGEYELHNADTPAQRVSLYAGIGHLAHLVATAV